MKVKHVLILLLMWLCWVSADASTWKRYSSYVTAKIQNTYDTGEKVYYLNCGCLFEFDKATTRTVALTSQNKLSDDMISQIYYDWENKLLFVAHTSCNIDIIDSVGTVYNISKLKDIVVDVRNYTLNKGVLESYTGKTINDINFAHGIAYVAVDYGYVTIDESTKTIKKNVILTQSANINSVAVIGNTMVFMTNGFCYHGPLGEENPIQNYTRRSGSYTGARMYPINDNSVFVLTSSALLRYDFSTTPLTSKTLVSSAPTSVQKVPDGFIANFANQKFYYTIDTTGTTATKASSILGFATSDPTGDGTVWINDGDGLRMKGSTVNYKLNSLTTIEPYWLKYNTAMDRLYVCSSALNGKNRTHPRFVATNAINYFDGTNWYDATCYTSSGSGYEFVFNPQDSTTYYRASWSSGLHKVTNDTLVLTYKSTNTPMGANKAHPAFDKYGNLWIVSSYGASNNPVAVLPRDKVARNTATKTDWFVPSGLLLLNTESFQRSRFVIAKKNNLKIYADCDYEQPIMCWDNFNEDITVDDYKLSLINHFVDQNNDMIRWSYLMHLEEDSNGQIWVGTMSGMFVFDPQVAFDVNPRAYTPYVTNYHGGKEKLCEGFAVYDFAEDRSHNKWIATSNGIYYVAPDASEIYRHFTTRNSDLPSDIVYSVECDNKHNRVYVYTENGFAEYLENGDSPSVDYDNVYSFPNPVEPDFTGLVKIAGLMAETYATITDRDGNIVAQLGPVNGSALWDACDASGERVSTGIYNVYAGQGAYPVISGEPHATIMIIK